MSLLPDRVDRTHDVYLSPDIWWTTLTAADVAKASEPIRRAFALWARPGAERLFDLQEDPDELNNLAGRPEYADVQQRLHDHLRQWQQQTHDPLLDADRLAKLTAEMDAVKESGREGTMRYPEYLDIQADAGPTSSATRAPK